MSPILAVDLFPRTRQKSDINLGLSNHVVDLSKDVAKLMWVKNGEIQQEEEGNVRMLMEIGALDRGDLLKNGFVEYVFITEDSTDLDMTKTFLLSNGFDLNTVDIWSYSGCSKVDTAIILANFIKEHAPGTKIILHRDRDYLSEEEVSKYIERVTAAVDYCFITRNLDLESYYIIVNSEQLYFKVYNALYFRRRYGWRTI